MQFPLVDFNIEFDSNSSPLKEVGRISENQPSPHEGEESSCYYRLQCYSLLAASMSDYEH
jgi:hypothetical protein